MGVVAAPAFVLLPEWPLADSDCICGWAGYSIRSQDHHEKLGTPVCSGNFSAPPLNLPLPPDLKGPGFLSCERRNLAPCVTHGRPSRGSRDSRTGLLCRSDLGLIPIMTIGTTMIKDNRAWIHRTYLLRRKTCVSSLPVSFTGHQETSHSSFGTPHVRVNRHGLLCTLGFASLFPSLASCGLLGHFCKRLLFIHC